MAKHTTLNSTRLVTYIYSPGRRTLCAMQSLVGAVLSSRVKNQGLWEADLIVTRGFGAFWFSQEAVIDLFE